MAKFCTNCGKKLEDKAGLCLNCGVLVGNNNSSTTNNNKKKGLPTWAIILIVVGCFSILPIIFITIIAVSAFNYMENTDFSEIIEEIVVQNGTIGDTLVTEDFKIKLTNVLTYDKIGKEEYEEVPEEGKEYIIFIFDVGNISESKESIYSNDFSGYVDGYAVSEKTLTSDIDGIKKLGASLLPGTKTKGYIAFEVEKGWQEFEIYFEDWFEDEQLVFTITNKENSNITGA